MATHRTRKRADGSISHQIIWRDPEKNHTQTSLTFDDEQEALLLKRFLEANGHRFTLAQQAVVEMRSTAPTLNKLIEHHLDNLTGVESGTIRKYRNMYRDHIQESIGTTRLDNLTKPRIIQWLKGINRTEKTLKNIHAIVSSALNTGIDSPEYPVETNIAKGIPMPKGGGNAKTPMFLTKSQFKAVTDQLRVIHKNAPEGVGTVFDPALFAETMVHSGTRLGEITALRKDIDTTIREDGRVTLQINRAWKRTGEGVFEGTPKSKASVRDITLKLDFSEKFIRYIDTLLPGALIFPSRTGSKLSESRFLEYYWDSARTYLQGAGILPRKPRIHDLRHTHASWLIQAGVPLSVIKKRLGHESIDTTDRVYGHLTTDDDIQAAEAA